MAEYRIVDRIGQGGMGIVYRAVQQPLDRPVAIKILPSSLMHTSGTAMPRFLREIQACTKLNHPNIIRIIDCGEMSGQPFFAMEFLEAQTLREMLADSGPLPCSQVIEIFRQMLEALEYCHLQGIIHRDIKPHNIMVDHLNHTTLMDFGLVKMLERSGITHSRRIVGSPNYMPPEMIQGKDVGVQADLWSLGCVVYELLTGERAFPGKVIRDIGLLILKSEPVPVPAKRPDCPIGLAQMLAGCLKKETLDRYQRAEHVLKDLVRVETGRAPLGPAAHGDSSASVPRVLEPARAREADAGPDETGAPRSTRKNPVRRPTAKAPVNSTLVGMPAEPRPRRFSLRSLVPRTWIERLAAAGLLVVAVLGLIVGTLVNLGSEGAQALRAAVRLEVGHDFVELAWSSAAVYAAVAVAVRADGSGEPVEVIEGAARTAHRLRLGGLERGMSYQLSVKEGDRVVFRSTTRTLAPTDLGDRLEAAIKLLDPTALTARLEADLSGLAPRERHLEAKSLALARVRDAHAHAIERKLEASGVAGALTRFRAGRQEFFLDDQVPAGRKRAVWLAVEALEDLRLLAQAAGIAGVPGGVALLKDAGFGPLPGPRLARATEMRASLAQTPTVRGAPEEGRGITLFTHTGYPDLEALRGGLVQVPPAHLVTELSVPVTLPPGIDRLEVGLLLTMPSPLSRVTLWAGADAGSLAQVAVFRGGQETSAWSYVALDPRLFALPQSLRLEFSTSNSMTPTRMQSVSVRGLTFRFTASGAN